MKDFLQDPVDSGVDPVFGFTTSTVSRRQFSEKVLLLEELGLVHYCLSATINFRFGLIVAEGDLIVYTVPVLSYSEYEI